MQLNEKISTLRRRAGLSQEQLADQLCVTRQSVSKWESGGAVPELVKLIALSDLLGVTVDALVRDGPLETAAPPDCGPALEQQVQALTREVQTIHGAVFAYTSRRRLWGLPLVCVRLGHARQPNRHNTAVGILAVGNYALGMVSVGLLCAGGVSIGFVGFGLLALGGVSIGGAAVGLSALGLWAAGVSAIGLRAFGVSALGVFRAAGLAAESLR